MDIHIAKFLDFEGIEHTDEDDIELAVGEERAGAHAVAEAVGKKWCVGVLEPAFGAEDIGVVPDGGIWGTLVRERRRKSEIRTHVTGPRVQEEYCLGGDDNSFIGDISD